MCKIHAGTIAVLTSLALAAPAGAQAPTLHLTMARAKSAISRWDTYNEGPPSVDQCRRRGSAVIVCRVVIKARIFNGFPALYCLAHDRAALVNRRVRVTGVGWTSC